MRNKEKKKGKNERKKESRKVLRKEEQIKKDRDNYINR